MAALLVSYVGPLRALLAPCPRGAARHLDGHSIPTRGLTALACVVDRPGYNARYRDQYGRKRWSLCKTAFHVVAERAAKYARREGARLRILVERSDKSTDARMKGYYNALRDTGQPFNAQRSAKYDPLSPSDFAETLYEFATKNKTSPLMQIADVVLWPVCIGGYRPSHPSYESLRKSGTLLDSKLPTDELATAGIKYSCWELEEAKAKKDQSPERIRALGQPPKG